MGTTKSSKNARLFYLLTFLFLFFLIALFSKLFAGHCPNGYNWNGKRCIRNAGHVHPRPPHKPQHPSCGYGYHWNGQRCIPNAPVHQPPHYNPCGYGYHRDSWGRCIPNRPQYPNPSPGACYSWDGYRWYYDYRKCARPPVHYGPGPIVVYPRPHPEPYGTWIVLDRNAEVDPQNPYSPYNDNALTFYVARSGIDGIELSIRDENLFIENVYVTYANGRNDIVNGISGFYPEGRSVYSFDINRYDFVESITIVGYSTNPNDDVDLLVRIYQTY